MEEAKTMKIMQADYRNCTVNLACSVLKAFGVQTSHATMDAADRLLQKPYKNVVLLVLDAMGQCVLDQNLDPEGFLNRHLVTRYTSVFPPTTVAATTSLRSGLYPAEHCWLGWECYYPQIDRNITVFQNREAYTGEKITDYHVAERFCPYQSVEERIRAAGGIAYTVTPYEEPHPQTFRAICEQVESLCRLEGHKYIYAYWEEPDHTMHRKGCHSLTAKGVIRALEEEVQRLCERLEDTLVLVTADHGQLDTRNVLIDDYPELMACLVRRPSIEVRAMNFFVKKGMEDRFRSLFEEYFGQDYKLMSKEEVRAGQLFGPGQEHPVLDGMLGDYLAVAVGNLAIYGSKRKKESFLAAHAGMTEDEMMLGLIAIECD